MTYYAQRKSIKGEQVTFNQRTGNQPDMLRQFFLYCASASTNEADNDYDFIDYGTIENGQLKKESFRNEKPEPNNTPEEE